MLDKNGYIEQIDSDNAREAIATQHEQLRYNFSIDADIDSTKINAIVVVGMGGSALAAQLVQTWWCGQLSIPFIIVRGYDLPAFVDEHTLVVCSSYSGNTEEVLSAYQQTKERGCECVVMASGGTLADQAGEDDLPLYRIPSGYQPRLAMWYGVRAFAELMQQSEFVSDAVSRLEEAAEFLQTAGQEWKPDVPTAENRAKQIAEECMGKAVWVYAGPILSSAAYKWKISFNESSKQVASWNELPEFNHNEFMGWTEQPAIKPFTVIELQSALDSERIRKRFEISNRLLSGRMPSPVVVESRGEAHIQHLLWTCLLGDFTSLYLGVLNNVNPSRVETIEQLKQELS